MLKTEGEDIFRASGSVMFRQTQRVQGTSDDKDDFDEANIEGTQESPDRFQKRDGRQNTLIENDNMRMSDGDIDDDNEKVADEEGYDENRHNIHGSTDSVIEKNLGIQQEDLRESHI